MSRAPSLLLLTLIVFISGSGSLSGDFVWDDKIFTLFNEAYRTFDLRAMLLGKGNGVEYLPVRDLSLALDFLIWGTNPAGFHFTNLVIYWLTVLTVFFFSLKLTAAVSPADTGTVTERDRATAFVTATLFALHPLHSEVLSFITSRNTLLSGLFFFLSLLCYLCYLELRSGRATCYWGALVTFILALFSKAIALPLPLILLLLLFLMPVTDRSRELLKIIPFFLISAACSVMFGWIAVDSGVAPPGPARLSVHELAATAVTALKIPWFYLGKVFLPLGLAPEYDVSFSGSTFAAAAIGSLLLLVLVIRIAFRLRRKCPWFSFGAGYYLLALIPVLNILRSYPVVADRYVYLPSFGLLFLLSTAVASLYDHHRRKYLLLVGLVVLTAGILFWRQNSVWQSDKTLWMHALRVSPRSVKAHTELGRVLFQAGEYDLAFSFFLRARELDPTNPAADFFTGRRLFAAGDYGNAAAAYWNALDRDGRFLPARYQLARAYELAGNRDRAITTYREVVLSRDLDPENLKKRALHDLKRLGVQP